ncbi:MAG: carbamoyltransferase [Candidatus Zixiibacteriota bacterium]
MRILGISCFYHDAAAALIVDGTLVAAVSEERFTRIKHDPELPKQAVQFCLQKANIEINQLDTIVFYDKPFTKFDRILTGYLATPFRSYRAFLASMPIWLRRKLWVEQVIGKELGYNGEVLFLPHHVSHAAGAFFGSPFGKAAILTIDGVGEWATASYGIGENNRVRLLAEMHYPHSVGLLYSAFTQYLGFQVNSAEYKVMGLAPYGTPRFAELIEEKIVTIHHDGSIHLNMRYFDYHHGLRMINGRFERLFGRKRRSPESPIESFHEDVAASVQAVTERVVLTMARHVRKETGLDKLCMSGGVALNCKANGLLLNEGTFSDIYVQPASGDAGGAVGAALYAYYKLTGAEKQSQPFFGIGPESSSVEIKAFLDKNGVPYRHEPLDDRLAYVADQLVNGRIVGFYQGAAEFGPRALGFRSILADPRDNTMKEKINAAVKYREPFRPFAPAVLRERVDEYFECDTDAPYMIFNFTVREGKRAVIPAVTHVDNSSRIQTVSRKDNQVLYDLLVAFDRLTGVPVLLNTSFNLRGHPIVNSPEEAFATFCSGGVDILLLGEYIINKSDISNDIRAKFFYQVASD